MTASSRLVDKQVDIMIASEESYNSVGHSGQSGYYKQTEAWKNKRMFSITLPEWIWTVQLVRRTWISVNVWRKNTLEWLSGNPKTNLFQWKPVENDTGRKLQISRKPQTVSKILGGSPDPNVLPRGRWNLLLPGNSTMVIASNLNGTRSFRNGSDAQRPPIDCISRRVPRNIRQQIIGF